MEYIIVSDSKLKIILTKDEIRSYGLQGAADECDTPKYRRAFKRILDDISKDGGFKVKGEKTLIQFYQSKAGGEIFVTKLGDIHPDTERALAVSDRVTLLLPSMHLFRFEDFFDLLSCLSLIKQSSLFARVFCDEQSFYLMLDNDSSSKVYFARIAEFGERMPDVSVPYVAEHTRELDFSKLCLLLDKKSAD